MVYTINGEQLTRRKLVTIDGSQVTTQTGIPLMLNIDLPNVATDGKDVRLAKLDGTPIAREIECVDVPNTDSVTIHYPFDTVASTDSKFYVYWGNASLSEPAVDSTYGSEAVWDSNYKAIYHMNHEPNGNPANALKDSTSNSYHQNPHGFSVNSLIDSEYGKGIAFDGTNDYFDRTAAAVSTGNWNVLIQHKTGSDITNLHNLISATEATQYYLAHHLCVYNGYHASYTSPGWFYAPTALSTNTEYIATFDYASAGTLDYYLDGVSTGSDSVNSAQDNMEIQTIGARTAPDRYYNSNIYEIRYSDIARSSNYIITTHKNLNNPTASGTGPFYKSISTPQHQRRVPQFIN